MVYASTLGIVINNRLLVFGRMMRLNSIRNNNPVWLNSILNNIPVLFMSGTEKRWHDNNPKRIEWRWVSMRSEGDFMTAECWYKPGLHERWVSIQSRQQDSDTSTSIEGDFMSAECWYKPGLHEHWVSIQTGYQIQTTLQDLKATSWALSVDTNWDFMSTTAYYGWFHMVELRKPSRLKI